MNAQQPRFHVIRTMQAKLLLLITAQNQACRLFDFLKMQEANLGMSDVAHLKAAGEKGKMTL